MLAISKRFHLNRLKMLGFLADITMTEDNTARSLYLPPGLPPPETEHLIEQIIGSPTPSEGLAEIAASFKTGGALFWGSRLKYLVSPPFPFKEKAIFPGYEIETLTSLLKADYRIALILIRLGAYAVGICEGERLVTSKVGTALVHGRHKKGGSSQQRFRRHREKQIESFMNRVCGHIQERFEPYAQTLDYLVYGGAHTTILELKKHCPFLRQFDNCNLPPLLDIPEPRQAVLEASVSRVWSSKIIEWQEV